MARSYSLRALVARLPPPAALALLYAVLIAVGTVLLRLPISHHGTVLWDEALFTSASAVTVTGLSLSDPGTTFTLFGQAVLAGLIQMGGLGLMTFAVLLLASLGINVGMPSRLILREDLGQRSLSNLVALARRVLLIAVICEAIGAAILWPVFWAELGPARGLWAAVFHSISAFNNAGFALFPESLSAWATNPVVTLTIAALFIAGGLGFIVLGDLWTVRRWHRLSLHSKLMIVGTLALTLWAWVLFATLEWSNPGTLGAIDSTGGRLLAAFFQGVTPRTAGFNTVDTAQTHEATALMTILLMLIGGGSTSTAGGIKVTTFIVLCLATLAFFQRRETLHVFGRSLGTDEVMKVMALTALAIFIVAGGVFVVAIGHDGDIFDLMFEVASAFGTVGLTRGTTPELDGVGRGVIIALMFIGRVGPLTLGFFLARPQASKIRYPAGHVYLG